MQRSLQAQIRDPTWLLARQWQMGEFLGDDAGSPMNATVAVDNRSITTYRPGTNDAKPVPLEVHVERETVELKLRGSTQSGLYFETLARSRAISNETILKFRSAFPIAADNPEFIYAPPDAQRFRHLVAGRVTDGEKLYAAAPGLLSGQAPPSPLSASDITPPITKLLTDFMGFRGSLFSEPNHDLAWVPTELAYQFTVESQRPNQNVSLTASDFRGGHLDWYSFSVVMDQPNQVPPNNRAIFNFLPNHVIFRGMPEPRFWVFEDATLDFGQLNTDTVDLPKLIVTEFALIYGNDWFWVPIPVTIGSSSSAAGTQGSLSRVTTLVVSDTFGVRTLIRPSEQTTVNPGESAWSMFKISGQNTRSDFILLPPTVGVVDNADALEEVVFLRDDIAALAWAVEHRIQGDLDVPVDAFQSYAQHAHTPLPGTQLSYAMEQLPPGRNWIPLVPVKTSEGALYFRRAMLAVPSNDGTDYVTAHGAILQPASPFFVADSALLPAGVQVDRYFRRTRSEDGKTFVWLARKSGLGRGFGWSGLRFDVLTPGPGSAQNILPRQPANSSSLNSSSTTRDL
jgi:hypothetical protein